MPRVRANKKYYSPNNFQGRKIIANKNMQRRKGNYILEETIGEGAFAKVKLGTHIHTGEKVAIKILNKEKLFEEALEDNLANGIEGCDIQKIRKEINILKRLRHKNVIQLYEIMESKTNLYIVMEYCEGKELFDYIVRHKYLSEKEACRFFQQIIDGVEYLHLSNITHRDLKPENLLLDNKKRIRISDFGLSNMGEKIDSFLETPCGTPSYAPPEMLRGEKYNGVYSDIWSCGIILYTMLVGNLPCAESKEDLIYENIMTHNYYFPDNISDEAIDLIENMLKVDPTERYDFEQIKSHPWFNLVEPKLKPGIVYGVHKIPIDENILNKVETFGYDKKKVLKSLENYSYDSNCSIYYLTLKQFTRENKSSISDLFSNKYLEYLKDYKNWLKPEEINNPLFMNYEVEMPFEIEQEKAKNYISNALLAYNENNNKKKSFRNIESIPEEETKYNNKSFDAATNIHNNNINDIDDNDNDNHTDLKHPLSTKNRKISINKRVFINEIEKFKKDDLKLKNQKNHSKDEKNKNNAKKNNPKTEKKPNANNSIIHSSIIENLNRNKKIAKKVGVNTSAKKIHNNGIFSSKIKTPDKKNKIRKNVSYGEISNYYDQNKNNNNLNMTNIQDIIKKRVINKKQSMDNKQNIQKKDKPKILDLSHSKKKFNQRNNKNNVDKNDNNDNKVKNKNNIVNFNNNLSNDNIIINEKNKGNSNNVIRINNNENKKKKKSNNINVNNKSNKNINNNNISNITYKNNVENNNKKDISEKTINDKMTEKSNNKIEDNNNDKNDKIIIINETKDNKIFKESLSKLSNLSKIDKTEENYEPKIIKESQNNNEIKNNLQNDPNNKKINQDQISNYDNTVLSDSSSISKTILSPREMSFFSSKSNNTGLNFNSNNASSFSKRVEYSNNKAKKRMLKPKFKKKIEEESNIELFTESINSIEKIKLMQKLENDEERLKNEINFINNITSDTTASSININNNDKENENLNMIHLMAKKMLKNSIFGKHLLNNKKPKKPIKEDIENKFYTLQKYKNIVGIVEHLKNKLFKKKYVDFNYETFDDYLNDEDDKIFNASLLQTMGINRFIRNAKECLYKNEKLNKRSQSKAYGLNTFKFNKIFQANRRYTRFSTTKNIDYYHQFILNNKKNFGYYKPYKNLNLSCLTSTTNSKSKIKNRKKNLNNYTTTNNDSMSSTTYNLMAVDRKKKYLSSEKNTKYYPEKRNNVPKKIRINIKTLKYNKKNNAINNNIK